MIAAMVGFIPWQDRRLSIAIKSGMAAKVVPNPATKPTISCSGNEDINIAYILFRLGLSLTWWTYCWFSFFKRKHPLPVMLHIYNGPALAMSHVERFVQPTDARCPVVCPFSFRVGMVYQPHEPCSGPGRSSAAFTT